MPVLDINRIKQFLPHRYPFLLVDKVLEYEPWDSLTAIKNVTFNEPCFQGHFPSTPIFPGVLLIESMAQSAALLGCISCIEQLEAEAESPADNSPLYYLVGVDKTRFKHTVAPGDQITTKVRFLKFRRKIWRFSVTANVGDKFIASAEIMTTRVET